jgi:hypothetical protein
MSNCLIADCNTSGQTVIFPDPCKDNTFAKAEAYLENFFALVTKPLDAASSLDQELKKTVRLLSIGMKGFVNSVVGRLQDELIERIKGGLEGLENKVRSLYKGNELFKALDQLAKDQGAQIDPVDNLFKALACLANKVTDAAEKIFTDLLSQAVKNVLNVPICAVEQILGAFTNKMIDIIESTVSPILEPIKNALEFVFDVRDFLVGVVQTFRKVENVLNCNEKKKCPPSTKYKINQGLLRDRGEGEQKDAFDRIFAKGALSRGAANLANDFENQYGSWSIFGETLENADPNSGCYTGNVVSCGTPNVEFFGGGGAGAFGRAILGNIINEVDTEGVIDSVQRTASIVGVEIEDPGSGYTTPPLISFTDACDKGYGAYGRANINSQGQVTSVSIISQGENYPTEGLIEDPLYIEDIVIENPGSGYSEEDSIQGVKLIIRDGQIVDTEIENFGYNGLPDLNINSNTGFGAVLRPIMAVVPPQREVIQVIDCVR